MLDTVPPPPDITPGRLFQHRFKNFSRKLRGKTLATTRLYADGPFLRVVDYETSIDVFPDNRWGRFSGGIRHRCAETAKQYCLDQFTGSWRDAVFLDLGANIGEVSVHALAKGARAFAIEADPHVVHALRRNADKHGFSAVHAVLGAEVGELPFYMAAAFADSSLIPPGGEQAATTPTVTLPVTPLDTLLAEHQLDRIDVIKLDAEGAEPEVLSGAAETLKKAQFVAVDCSAERQGEETVDACRPLLDKAGLSTRVIRGGPGGRVALLGARSA